MAAVVKPLPSAGNHFDFGYRSGSPYHNFESSSASPTKKKLFTQSKSVGDAYHAGASPLSKSHKQHGSRPTLRNLDTNMSSYTSTATIPASNTTLTNSERRNRLHKRASSGASLPGQIPGTRSPSTTPYSTYEDPFPDIDSTTPTSSTPKIKPYLRKISSNKEDQDQGRLDLSKSVSQNETLAGLGIQDFGARTVSEGVVSQPGRRTPHTRTTSGGSTISTGSGSYRPSQTFMHHPMRQTPHRPYTPPTTDASSMDEDEARESSDIVTDDDFRLVQGLRNRSTSTPMSSTIQIAPTPLSQSHTAADLGAVPKLTSSSQTNLSIKSGRSLKSARSKLGRSQTDTHLSNDYNHSPSSRTSFDKAFSLVSRRSETESQSREDRIRAARRKFEEKESNKDRKLEKKTIKRREMEEVKQERQRRKSEASERARRKSEASDRPRILKPRDGPKDGRGIRSAARQNEEMTALPRQDRAGGMSEKTSRGEETRIDSQQSGGSRFLKILSCGIKR